MPLFYTIVNMQIINQTYENISPGYPLEEFAPPCRILFIDIETTGLSREHSNLYLIGCGFFEPDGYHTIQWFADSPSEEADIITAFAKYISGRFTHLIHYNGNHFDVPYLKYKTEIHNLDDPLLNLISIDIFVLVKPYKHMLGLPSLRQRCIEQFLNINSDDPYTGKELIGVYHSYTASPSKKLLEPLLYHNSEDLKGMAYILPILHYTSLKSMSFKYVSHKLHTYHDYNGIEQYELLVDFIHTADIPVGFKTGRGQIILSIRSDRTALLRLPVLNCEMKKFYDNYRDYFYLPAEDCCIHRSAASGVDKSRREYAKKETCYTKHSGLFIPSVSDDPSTTFRIDYSSREFYVPYSEDTCKALLTEFGLHLMAHIF